MRGRFLVSIAFLALRMQDYVLAARMRAQIILLWRTVVNHRWDLEFLDIAGLALIANRHDTAALLLGAFGSAWERMGIAANSPMAQESARIVTTVCDAIRPDRLAAYRSEGAAMALEMALGEAEALLAEMVRGDRSKEPPRVESAGVRGATMPAGIRMESMPPRPASPVSSFRN
jgi:hypothetical protein